MVLTLLAATCLCNTLTSRQTDRQTVREKGSRRGAWISESQKSFFPICKWSINICILCCHIKSEEIDFLAQNNSQGEQEAVLDVHSGAYVPPPRVLDVETFHLLTACVTTTTLAAPLRESCKRK